MAIATSDENEGFRGAAGKYVFRKYNDKTVVSLRPVYKNETNTEGRRRARGRFREATEYASRAMKDVKLKAYYKQKAQQLKLPNAYTAAITDFLRKAKAEAMTRSSFSARKGDLVRIYVDKPVLKINRIKAIVYNQQGKMLSEQVIQRSDQQKPFEFILTDDFPDYGGFKILTEDEPGDKAYMIPAEEFLPFI